MLTKKVKTALLAFVTISLLVFIILFIRKQSFDINSSIDTAKFSEFGGFVGGVFGSLSLFLVILAYYASIEADERSKVEAFYQHLNSEINEASYDGKKGIEAWLAFKMKDDPERHIKHVMFDQLNVFVYSFNTYSSYIDNSKLLSKSDKEIYRKRFYLLYYSKILWSIRETVMKDGQWAIDNHDDSKFIIPLFCRTSINVINYLMEKEIAKDSQLKNLVLSRFEQLSKYK